MRYLRSVLLTALLTGAGAVWGAPSEAVTPSHWWSFLSAPDYGQLASVGAYGGTMGTGVRLELDGSERFAPLSLTVVKRDITLQATTGENLDTTRKVISLAYEPRLLSGTKRLGQAIELRTLLAIPLGLTAGENRSVSSQVTEFIAGPFPGTGEYVTRDIVMRDEDKGVQVGLFVGIQPSVEFRFSERYLLIIGADLEAGVPFSSSEQAKKDVTRASGFISLGLRF